MDTLRQEIDLLILGSSLLSGGNSLNPLDGSSPTTELMKHGLLWPSIMLAEMPRALL